jgi:hypothetical protein
MLMFARPAGNAASAVLLAAVCPERERERERDRERETERQRERETER